jgi:hypothetical protein
MHLHTQQAQQHTATPDRALLPPQVERSVGDHLEGAVPWQGPDGTHGASKSILKTSEAYAAAQKAPPSPLAARPHRCLSRGRLRRKASPPPRPPAPWKPTGAERARLSPAGSPVSVAFRNDRHPTLRVLLRVLLRTLEMLSRAL